MRKLILSLCLASSFVGAGFMAHAEESVGEKAKADANDVKRSVKKGAHRAEEHVCAEGDAKCAGKKVKHRAQEGSDYVKDKASEAKDKAD